MNKRATLNVKKILASKTFDRIYKWIAIVAGICGILQFILPFVNKIAFISPLWMKFANNEYYFYHSALLFIAALYIKTQFAYCRSREVSCKNFRLMQITLDELRIIFAELTYKPHIASGKNVQYPATLLSRVKRSARALSNTTASMLRRITGEPIHICVKQIVGETMRIRVRSDAHSDGIRDSAPEIFNIEKNSVFKKLIDDPTLKYLYSNDLAKEKTYRNINPKWKKHYNATLVVKIEDEYGNLWGFICADSMVGRFDDHECVNILEIMGTQIFNLLNAVDQQGDKGYGDPGYASGSRI